LRFEEIEGIGKCIGTSAQRNANHHNTPFEAHVMFNASFLKELSDFGSISNNLIRKAMAPEHAQKAFRVLASKSGSSDFDFTSNITLSFIFKVCICLVRIRKSSKVGSQFKFEKTFFSCWKTEEVIDELILSKSIKKSKDDKTKELQYSILMCNSSASDLVNIDLDNYADYMEERDKKLLEEIEAGMPARKVVRPIPEDDPTENAAANADKQTTKENEGSIENADANENKKTTVEKEGAALRLLKIQQLPEKSISTP
jgi:hypothetical protein